VLATPSCHRVPQILEADRSCRSCRSFRPSGVGQLCHPQDQGNSGVVPAASSVPPALHSHAQFLAEPGGALVRLTVTTPDQTRCTTSSPNPLCGPRVPMPFSTALDGSLPVLWPHTAQTICKKSVTQDTS